jgi:hypothetical protein
MTYKEKLQHPQWLKKRAALFEERGERCQSCGETEGLTVHHGYYRFKTDPWEYEDSSLWVLCWPCHERLQLTLTQIHQIVGHIHPDEYEAVKDRVSDSTFDLRFGITKDDLEEILAEEKEAESTLYSEYAVSIISSTELGPTVAHDLEDAVCQRFPGIEAGVLTPGGERDGIVSVSGPDSEISSMIEAWCHKWSRQY